MARRFDIGFALSVLIAVASFGLGVMLAIVGEPWPALTWGWSSGVWTCIVARELGARG
jgi:hypothetical protein